MWLSALDIHTGTRERAAMTTSAGPWTRIDAWLRKHAKLVFQQLRPPATEAALTAAERLLGLPLPASLSASYRAHDGARGESPAVFAAVRAGLRQQWVRSVAWLPLDLAVKELRAMQRIFPDWPTSLLPIGSDGGGNHVLVDLVAGTVLLRDHETDETDALAPDFHTWMTWLAEDMDSGRVTDEDSDDGELLTLLEAPPPPPPPPPLLAPDRAARMLLEVLVERRHIALSTPPSEALVQAVNDALRCRGPKRRLEAVLHALGESDAVDEIFASDPEIAAAIKDVG